MMKHSKFSLVGGAITILKNDGVRQWEGDDIPYMKWKIKAMFETTNQIVDLPIQNGVDFPYLSI